VFTGRTSERIKEDNRCISGTKRAPHTQEAKAYMKERMEVKLQATERKDDETKRNKTDRQQTVLAFLTTTKQDIGGRRRATRSSIRVDPSTALERLQHTAYSIQHTTWL
jgi:hypothetical protein